MRWFDEWFRKNCIIADGKVGPWWKHALYYLPVSLWVGFVAARLVGTSFPVLVGFMVGWLATVYSYQQDIIVNGRDGTHYADLAELVRTAPRITALVLIGLLSIVAYQLW